MKISLSAFADEASENFSEQLQVLVKHNIPYIELRGLDGKNVSALSEKDALGYKKMMDDANIKVWAIGSPLGKIDLKDNFELHLQLCEHTFALANIFGTDKIRVFSFYGTRLEQDGEEVFQRLSKMCSLAGKYGVTLYHENEKEIFGSTPEKVEEILNNVREMKSVFDPANYVQCGVDAGIALQKLRSKSNYYHIKDAIAGTGEVVPAGEGDGCLDALIGGLKDDTVLTLEPHLTEFGGYASIDPTQLKGKHVYANGEEAFAVAADTLVSLLKKYSFKAEGREWIK